jgi:septum site-determining protein MinD
MAGKVIVITSGKGGVGKTTTTANIGMALAERDKKVVVIDADIGLRNLDMLLGLENRIVYDLVHLVEKRCEVRQALIRDKRVKNLYLIPAAQTRDKDAVSPEQMIELTNKLKEDFDYIIIDSPAGIERGFKNSVAGADIALLVTTPEVSSVRDVDRVIGLLEAANKKEHYLVINRIKPDMVKKGDMMDVDDVLQILAIELIGIVPDDGNMIKYTNKGEPAVLDTVSIAGKAYKNIAARIEGEDVPFIELKEKKSLMDVVKSIFG